MSSQTITDSVEAAVSALSLDSSSFHRLSTDDALALERRVRQRFVKGTPRVLWLGFEPSAERYTYDATTWQEALESVLGRIGDATCHLLIEADSPELPTYVVRTKSIVSLLSQCEFFEYYVVPHDLSFMVADTDHNELLVTSTIELEPPESATSQLP
jgi:hypothetical protein